MKKFLVILMLVAMASFLLVGCLPTPNVGPVFTSTPGKTATVGTAYTYTPTATDAEGETVTFTVAGITGMTISTAGVITWTPTTAQIGANSAVVTASDGTNATAQTVAITVSAAVTPAGAKIDIAAIPGVTAPVAGAIPDTTVTKTAQYTGVTTWSPTVVGTFAGGTVYTATITLTPRTGYTLTGVLANFFTVAGAASDTNPADSGVVTAVYAKTPAVAIVSIPAILGVTAPVTGAAPVLLVDVTNQYTGVVTWSPVVKAGGKFAAGTVYTATITLTPKAGFTLTGELANFFTVAGAAATNPADSGVVKAVFPATLTPPTVVWTTTGNRNGVINANETLVLTFSVAMKAIDLTGAGVLDASLAATDTTGLIARVHGTTYGTDVKVAWNTGNTVLTVTYLAPLAGLTIVKTDIITPAATFISAVGKIALTPNPYTVGAVLDF